MAKASEIAGLDCEASASLGIRLVLSARLKEMCALRTAALKWSDPEGVHDMRVASRRLRSAIKDFSAYLRENKLRSSATALKKIAKALGEVRDQDVAIMELEKNASDAPSDVAGGITHLISELHSKRKRARAALVEAITKSNLARFEADFESSLDGAVKVSRPGKSVDGGTEKTGLSFRETGVNIIKANFEKVHDLSTNLYSPFKTKPLHRMRIAAKRLRYATKLLAPCWPDQLEPFDKEVGKLQTALGELHDCDSWIAVLGEKLSHAKGRTDAGTIALDGNARVPGVSRVRTSSVSLLQVESACVWLLSRFVKARTEHYRAALNCWHEWEATGFRNRLFAVIEAQPVEVDPANESASRDARP